MSVSKIIISVVIPTLLIGVCIWAVLAQFNSERYITQPVKSLKTAQGAAVHLGYPSEDGQIPQFDPLFDAYSAFTLSQIPVSDRFDSPMGTEAGGFIYNAQGFNEANNKRGGYHLGDDLNGIGGQNTDDGDAIYAAADGLVVYSGRPSNGWDRVVIIAHKLKDGRVVQTLYGHLKHTTVLVGSLIGRGQRIGSIGTAGGNYYAHLHYEIRESNGVVIGGGYAGDKVIAGELIDPTKFAATYNVHPAEDMRTSALKLLLEDDRKERLLQLQNQF